MIKKIEIEKALQSMLGFKLGRWGADSIELISTIGLTKEEWNHIKNNEDCGHLDDDDIKEINEYFSSSSLINQKSEDKDE